jgi:hypothetical protein
MLAHFLEAALNCLLLSMLLGKTGPFPDVFGLGSV